jgi:alpha(1,3/1,4) fucosyltransferase
MASAARTPRIALYFDPVTHHFLEDRLFDRQYAGHAGDQILAPYAHMKEYLNARGVEVHTADYLPEKPDGAINIYVTAGSNRYKRLANRQDVILSAFFLIECPSVEPSTYREMGEVQHLFKRVYTWSDSDSLRPFVGGSIDRCHLMRWPQSFDTVHAGVWEREDRAGFLVMLNGNKLPRYRTTACRELYSERMRAVEYFSRTKDIDLYGVGWDGPTFRVGKACVPGTFGKVAMPGTGQKIVFESRRLWQRVFPDPLLVAARSVYRGFARSKAEALSKYKFSLCFENSILKGWTTEKIFDCFFAGTVPVYWGAPDVQDYIPKDCYIDMRQFKDYGELRSYLKSLGARDIQRYKEAARDFLHSPRYRPFTKQAFAETFGRMIEEDAGVKLAEAQIAHA